MIIKPFNFIDEYKLFRDNIISIKDKLSDNELSNHLNFLKEFFESCTEDDYRYVIFLPNNIDNVDYDDIIEYYNSILSSANISFILYYNFDENGILDIKCAVTTREYAIQVKLSI